jgi:hypothetical protein
LKVVALVGAHAALAGRRGKQEVCSALYALLLLARRGAERTSPQGEKPCDQMATAFSGAFDCEVARRAKAEVPAGLS